MFDVTALIQVKAFAKQDALAMALLWIVSFACWIYLPQKTTGMIVALLTPFLMGWLLTRFREKVLDGVCSFRRGTAYCVYTFFYASLLFAAAQYIYFRFLDGGKFLNILSESITSAQAVYEANGIPVSEIRSSLEVIKMMSPLEIAFSLMMQNILIGALLSPIIGLICSKKHPTLTQR